MKLAEIEKCAGCGESVAKPNGLMFYQVTIQRMAFDHRAARAMNGLELITGSHAIAEALAPDAEIAKPLGEPTRVCICDDCACSRMTPLAAIDEIASKRRDDDAGDEPPTPGRAA